MNNINDAYKKIAQMRAKGENIDREVDNLIVAFESTIISILKGFNDIKEEDKDILMQDGRMAVNKAIHTYVPKKGASFYTFANTCIKNALSDEVESIQSKKIKNLTGAAQIDEKIENQLYADEDIEEQHDNAKRIQKALANMTKEEREVITLYVEGYSYDEMAKMMNKKAKDIDNILARIRKNNRSRN